MQFCVIDTIHTDGCKGSRDELSSDLYKWDVKQR